MAGRPIPQGRPRARVVTPRGGKPFVQIYPEAKTRDWEEQIADQIQRQIARIPVEATSDGDRDFHLPFEGRVLISMRFNLHKPVSYGKDVVHHLRKPDLDNLVKSVLDGLVKGRLIKDDNIVTDLTAYKRYVSDGHPEGVEIDLTAIG